MENIKIISSYTQKLSLAILERNNSISSRFGEYLGKLFKDVTYLKFQDDLYDNSADIVIIDLATQDKDSGFTFIKHLREKNPNVKILVHSMFTDTFLLQNCIRYDVSGFLTTDSTITDLKSYLKNCVDKIFITINNKLLKHNFPELSINNCITYLGNERDSKVSIVNQYKGLPLVKEAIILYYDEKSVTLKTDDIQIKSLNLNDTIALTSDYLGIDILASVTQLDLDKAHLVLNYINFIDGFIHHRKSLRLDAEDTSDLLIIDKNKRRVKSKVVNLSSNHILCEITNFNEFKMHDKLTLNLKLNERSKVLTGTSIVKDIFNTNRGFKMLVRFSLNQVENQALDNYLSLRVKKLITELKNK